MTGIYKITSPTGKVYIGLSRNIHRRWNDHRKIARRSKLCDSFKSHGVSNHIFEIIQELPFDTSDEVLGSFEKSYIAFYRSAGFEMLNVADGGFYAKVTEEAAMRISNAKKGVPQTKEHAEKLSKIKTGKKRTLTPEVKEKYAKIFREFNKKPKSPETIEKLRQATINYHKKKKGLL